MLITIAFSVGCALVCGPLDRLSNTAEESVLAAFFNKLSYAIAISMAATYAQNDPSLTVSIAILMATSMVIFQPVSTSEATVSIMNDCQMRCSKKAWYTNGDFLGSHPWWYLTLHQVLLSAPVSLFGIFSDRAALMVFTPVFVVATVTAHMLTKMQVRVEKDYWRTTEWARGWIIGGLLSAFSLILA